MVVSKEKNYVEFEDLVPGMIFAYKTRARFDLNVIYKKTNKKVWYIKFDRDSSRIRSFWRRNYGDTDSFDFYYPDEIGFLVKSSQYKRIIINYIFSRNIGSIEGIKK